MSGRASTAWPVQLFREDADELARRQEIERHSLPPIPPDRNKGKEKEQQQPQFERGRWLEPPSYER